MKDSEATEKAVNQYFTELAKKSSDPVFLKSGKKLLNFIYYSGYGVDWSATHRVLLEDTIYPLELKILQFKNEHPENTFNIGVLATYKYAYGSLSDSAVETKASKSVSLKKDY